MKTKMLIIITLLFGLFSCSYEKNGDLDKSFDFSRFYSDQCPEGEFMTSWTKYQDGTIKVNKCVKKLSCPKGQEIISQCSSMIGDVPCELYCIQKGMSLDW